MSFKIPPIPQSVSTAGAKAPTDVKELQEQPMSAQTAEQEAPQSVQVTFEMPLHMFQAFQAVVKKAEYLEGQEVLGLLQAVDLWLQATTNSLDGNQMIFMNKDGMSTHTNMNPKLSPEDFQKKIFEFHNERQANVEKMQAAQAKENQS